MGSEVAVAWTRLVAMRGGESSQILDVWGFCCCCYCFLRFAYFVRLGVGMAGGAGKRVLSGGFHLLNHDMSQNQEFVP